MISASEQDAIILHVAFSIISLVLLLPHTMPLEPSVSLGIRIWTLVLGYNISLIQFALQKSYREWMVIIKFLIPLSMFMVVPDVFLVTGPKTVVFPDMGVGRIHGVSSFMALMWTIPLFASTLIGRAMEARGSGVRKAAFLGAGLSGLVLIVGSEEILTRIPIWHAQNCSSLGWPLSHVAAYLLLPEYLLPVVTFLACRYSLAPTEGKSSTVSFPSQVFGAFLTMCMYMGLCAFSYMVVEVEFGSWN